MLDAAIGAIDSIPRARRKDIELVAEAVRRAVRAAANEAGAKSRSSPCSSRADRRALGSA